MSFVVKVVCRSLVYAA
ncbi:hypothetical protein OC514_23375, partial [Vibrio vulnificus]|nr:hypothetical protein [Vibrio vulnificus]